MRRHSPPSTAARPPATQAAARGYSSPQIEVLRHVLGFWTVILLVLAAVNAVVITWVTVLDNRRSSALARALGATPGEVTVALAAAQVVPALVGAVLGVFPGGFLLFSAITVATGGDRDRTTLPSLWQSAIVVLATVLVVAALTALPARLGAPPLGGGGAGLDTFRGQGLVGVRVWPRLVGFRSVGQR